MNEDEERRRGPDGLGYRILAVSDPFLQRILLDILEQLELLTRYAVKNKISSEKEGVA